MMGGHCCYRLCVSKLRESVDTSISPRLSRTYLDEPAKRVNRVHDLRDVFVVIQVWRAEHLKLLHAQRAHGLQVVCDVLHLLERHCRGVVDLGHAAGLERIR